MVINITYPTKHRRHVFWHNFCKIFNIIFVCALVTCPIINIVVGGKAWSIIALMGCFIIWSIFINPARFELNIISQYIKLFLETIILLIHINIVFDLHWGVFVIPIVGFGGLTLGAILFFSDFYHQKHHSIPFISTIIICLVTGIVGIALPNIEIKWVYIVLLSLSAFLLILSLIFLRYNLIEDLRKKFNFK